MADKRPTRLAIGVMVAGRSVQPVEVGGAVLWLTVSPRTIGHAARRYRAGMEAEMHGLAPSYARVSLAIGVVATTLG